MQVIRYDRFGDLPAGVARMLSYPEQTNFFRSLDWFECLYRTTLASEYEPRIYVADQCALFCMAKPGSGELLSMTNFYTVDYGVTSVADSATAMLELRAIIDFIKNERPRWTVLQTMFMDGDDILRDTWGWTLHSVAFHVQPFTQYENWYMRTGSETFQQYYATRPTQLRNTVERKSRALSKQFKVQTVIYDEDGPDLDKGIRDYVTVMGRSWKKEEPYPEFIPSLVKACAGLGILRLGLICLDERPAATQLWINTKHHAMIYKLAYDEEFKSTSVGSVLSVEMFRRAIDVDKVQEIDYGVGSEPYKKDWMSNVRLVHGLHSLNLTTWRGSVLATTELAKGMAKAIQKQARKIIGFPHAEA